MVIPSNFGSLNLNCKYENNMHCTYNIQNIYIAEYQIELIQPQSETLPARIEFSLAWMFSLYWLHVCWKITLSKRFFMFVFFLLCAKYVFVLLLTRALKKFNLYMNFYILVIACMQAHFPKDSRQSEHFSFQCFFASTYSTRQLPLLFWSVKNEFSDTY